MGLSTEYGRVSPPSGNSKVAERRSPEEYWTAKGEVAGRGFLRNDEVEEVEKVRDLGAKDRGEALEPSSTGLDASGLTLVYRCDEAREVSGSSGVGGWKFARASAWNEAIFEADIL